MKRFLLEVDGSDLSPEIENWSVRQIFEELLNRNTPMCESEESLKRFSFPFQLSDLAADYSSKIVTKLRDIQVRMANH